MEDQFSILLAGKSIGIHPLYSRVRRLCRDYLTDQVPDFEIEISSEDIVSERLNADKEAEREVCIPGNYGDAYLETLSVYRKIADHLLDEDILLFHGSVIAVDGIGYLFTAKSGTGKSTHTKLWRKMFGDRAVMVNDDKPLLKITDDGVVAYGTPWDGKHHLSNNIAVPLKAICILSRGDENHIKPIGKSDAFPMLCQQSYRPKQREQMLKALSLVNRLGSCVKLYRLECNMDPEAAQIAYAEMNR